LESHFRENQERQIIKNLHVKTQSHLTALLGVLAINAALLFLRGGVPAQAGPPAPGALSHPGAAMSAAESQPSRPAPSRAEAAPPRPAGMPAAARLTVGADETDAIHPARMNPAFSDENWMSMGDLVGADGTVHAAVMDAAGHLYVGGDFTVVAGVIAHHIAQWDGRRWSPIGSGLNDRVLALAVVNGDLYTGGEFLLAGGKVSPYLAWANLDGAPPIPPGGVVQGASVEGGTVALELLGVPGATYAVQRATNVEFTQALRVLLTTNTPSDGRFRLADTSPPPTSGFYRLVRQ